MMKRKLFIPFIIMILLAACRTGGGQAPAQANLIVTSEPSATQPVIDSGRQSTGFPTADTVTVAATPTHKPPLEKDAWKQMPAVPTGISDAMRAVYQQGLAMGNDPKHFSIIGD